MYTILFGSGEHNNLFLGRNVDTGSVAAFIEIALDELSNLNKGFFLLKSK